MAGTYRATRCVHQKRQLKILGVVRGGAHWPVLRKSYSHETIYRSLFVQTRGVLSPSIEPAFSMIVVELCLSEMS
jgi:hypothetical protein